MWLTEGHFTDEFERALEIKFGRRHALMCNSGSSANLLALAALGLPKGSEVITCAVGFPTTVNPIIQLGLVPVFVDCDYTMNIDADQLEDAYTHKTQAVMFAHALGNPANLTAIMHFAQKYDVNVIEDCCDAAGATYNGQRVGTFGDVMTLSFYPAHQITTGEGGAVLTNDAGLARSAASLRDWGRDCWCAPGCDNTCGRRYEGEYDHKYTYSSIGWNLKSTDLQAAVGLTQLVKLDSFIARRRSNWQYLWSGMADVEQLCMPYAIEGAEPSWFGFAMGCEKRNDLARFLDEHKIGNRPLFAGNLLRQPAYKSIDCRIVGGLRNADYVHDNVLWVGCWPGLTREMLDYTIQVIHEFYR